LLKTKYDKAQQSRYKLKDVHQKNIRNTVFD
jgi:hypothetical protein